MSVLQNPTDRLLQLERSWALGLQPSWAQQLLPEDLTDHPQWAEHTVKVCEVDLNWRLESIAAGKVAFAPDSLVCDEYLKSIAGRLPTSGMQRLVSLEFALRWSSGLFISREEYLRLVPTQYRPSTLEVLWCCPAENCQAENATIDDGSFHQVCQTCLHASRNEEIFHHEPRWVESNAPNWLLVQLASNPTQVGMPGTFGAAYLVNDQDTHGQRTVVKILHARWSKTPDVVSRFLRESRILSLLDGEGTPAIRRAGRLPDGRHYYQMQWIDGTELRESVESLSVYDLIDRFEDVVRTIAVAHDQGVIHRDISPRNVVLDARRGRAVVLDWGQGKILADGSENLPEGVFSLENGPGLTAASGTFGTPGFQAPEVLQSASATSKQSDVFALGALLLYLLTKGQTFAAERFEQSSGPRSIIRAHSAIDELSQHGPVAEEPELLEICKSCLHSEHSSRPVDASDVAARLRSWRIERQKRLDLVPLIRSRNRFAWGLLAVFIAAGSVTLALALAWRWEAEDALKTERILGETRELARQKADEFAHTQKQLAVEKSREADNARAFSQLLINVFESSDPLGLEGTGFRHSAEAVQEMNAVELLHRVSNSLEGSDFLTTDAKCKALDGIGNALRSLGEASRAELLLTEAAKIQSKEGYSGSMEDRIQLEFHLALLYHDLHDHEAAQRHYKKSLDLLSQSGEVPLLREQIEFRYGWLLAELHETSQARELFLKVKNSRNASLGKSHPDTQAATVALILMNIQGGDKNSILEQVQDLSESDSAVLELFKNYIPARIFRETGLNQQAEKAYESLLRSAREVLPPFHPIYGMLLGDMAGFYRKVGNKARAFALAEEALEVARQTIPTHPFALELITELGRHYEEVGELKKAESLFEDILKLLEGKEAPRLIDCRSKFEASLHRIRSQLPTQSN